ncbi:hypothetical protein OIU77_029443 [Salix suchowensis]|uniref:Uncharacterized protein n=1 Tax=Salix suchowensis TaxID=1278906 RepID=A0ABQ9BBI2_9ROSI|nr:hypothetical protein OIU77_029443 [Salix suchowensis]
MMPSESRAAFHEEQEGVTFSFCINENTIANIFTQNLPAFIFNPFSLITLQTHFLFDSITMQSSSRFYFELFCLLLLLPTLALGECTCDAGGEEDTNKSEALKYKAIAIASILFAGAVGVCLPVLGKSIPVLSPERSVFFIIKAFAAGVILSTAFIHVLPDAFDSLTSPCLGENPWGQFPFTGFVAMMSAIGTLMVDCLASSYFTRLHLTKAQPDQSGDEEKAAGEAHVHTHATHGHSHGIVDSSAAAPSQLIRQRVITQVIVFSLSLQITKEIRLF